MLTAAACLVSLACTNSALAQTSGGGAGWPNKPIRIISPFAPGGGNDTLSRLLALSLTTRLGQQVVVENRPGANTIVGTEVLVKSPPDGYTLIVLPNAITINPFLYDKLPFDVVKDLAPVASIGNSATILVTHPSFPAHTMKEFVAVAKARPGQITNGSSGNGSIGHLTGALLDMLTGTKLVHVPYKGTSLAMTELIGGQIDISFGSALGVIPHIRAKRLNAIAVTSSHRTSAFPDLPTGAESIPGFSADLWYGLYAPAQTPVELITRLNREATAIFSQADMKAKLADQGVDPQITTPQEMARMIAGEMEKWSKVVKATGLRLH
jgi:tripartite-type tricarboxylate transporter receptor subunit TctC